MKTAGYTAIHRVGLKFELSIVKPLLAGPAIDNITPQKKSRSFTKRDLKEGLFKSSSHIRTFVGTEGEGNAHFCKQVLVFLFAPASLPARGADGVAILVRTVLQ
jgi:hypothetical protein